jgi:transposase
LDASGRKPEKSEVRVPRTRPPYPEEFRREAIRLALLGDEPQRQLAKDLGISDVTLRNWIKQERAERGERPGGLSRDEREELNRLRDENPEAADGAADPLKGGRLLREGERRAVGEASRSSPRRRSTTPSP